MTVSKNLLALVTLLLIGLGGYTSFLFLPFFWSFTQSGKTESVGEVTSNRPDDFSPQLPHPGSGSEVTKTPTRVGLPPPQQVSTPTPLLLSEPTLILEPTSTPTRLIIVIPTATPTPFPTATNSPTATDTPTLAPTASPTATSLPTATAIPTSTPTVVPTATSLPTAILIVTPTVALQGDISHVVIISIDGMRPDALVAAEAPHLDELIATGAYSPNAQTVTCSETLPGHAAMLSGMTPEKNGIVFGMPYIGWPGMNGPTLFSVAHEAGLSTAMVFGKEKLNYLVLPNSVDQLFGVDMHDPEIKLQAVEIIEAGLPAVLFVHFPDNDRVGHKYGWMSENQLYAIAYVDGLIGELVAALEDGGYLSNTLLIITADHGGHGFKHGDDSPLDRTIPWLAVGPGVPQGVTLTRNINIYDTAATALYALDLPIPETWDGQPIVEIFQ